MSKRQAVWVIVLAAVLGLFLVDRARGFYFFAEKPVNATVPASGFLPLQKLIEATIHPLEYSALPTFVDPGATLRIDFPGKTWTVGNFRRYDEQGTFLLRDGRYGLCAELAVHVSREIKPFLGERYVLKFARATEPDFFDSIQSNHIVLLLSDRLTGEILVIDPSFHRYGRAAEFSRYGIHGVKESLPSFEKSDKDATFPFEGTLPLAIRDGALLAFSVEPAEGVLDRENILLAISARRPGAASRNYLLGVSKQQGANKVFKNEALLPLFLTPEEQAAVLAKLLAWIRVM